MIVIRFASSSSRRFNLFLDNHKRLPSAEAIADDEEKEEEEEEEEEEEARYYISPKNNEKNSNLLPKCRNPCSAASRVTVVNAQLPAITLNDPPPSSWSVLLPKRERQDGITA